MVKISPSPPLLSSTVQGVSSELRRHCTADGSRIITEALQGLQIIPRSPSPVRSSTPIPLEERPFETLTQEEKDEIVRRQQVSIES